MAKKNKKYIFLHLPWQILMITIFVLSSIPGDDLPDLHFRAADKVAHLLIFGILAVLIFRSFENAGNIFFRDNARMLAIACTILYGAVDELHQLLTVGRSASFWDWIADIAGAIILVSAYETLRSRWPLLSKNRESG